MTPVHICDDERHPSAPRQGDGEAGPPEGAVGGGDGAAVGGDHGEDDRQPETGPAVAGGACVPVTAGPFSGDRYFNWTWKIESFIAEKVPFLPDSFPVSFINILNVTGPKGTGISTGNLAAACINGGFLSSSTCLRDTETKVEVFEDARLSLDTSKVFWGKPGIWDTFIGYRYWENKFGTNHSAPLFSLIAPGTSIESTFYTGTTYHFK